MELKFVNADHERIYREANALLAHELERQRAEWSSMEEQWRGYPDRLLAEKRSWLRVHQAECRRPYEKILTDIVALCPTARIITNEEAANLAE